MPVHILMPALSPTMTEGNLVKWLKSEGDSVKAGEVLAEIETDKATMEVEAVDEGILGKIIVSEGTEGVKVNSLIALLLEEGEDASTLTSVKEELSSASIPVHQKPQIDKETKNSSEPSLLTKEGRVFASPLARRLAEKNQIDLSLIQGSGPRGRIIKADVDYPKKETIISMTKESYIDLPLNNMRKVIAKRLTQAKQEIPHFYLTIECDIDALLTLRSEINQRLEDQKLSVNDFIVRACALALIKVPEANTAWLGDVLRQYQTADVCVAVAVDGGLVTPIVHHAHTKSVREISAAVKVLAEKARTGKLMPEEYQGGTFTISNLGMYGIQQFSAILNPPQSCILAVGAGEQKPVVREGAVKIATVMTCTLSVDHRAVDGAIGSKFLTAFKDFIEDPLKLLV